jgi:hypothetical protein
MVAQMLARRNPLCGDVAFFGVVTVTLGGLSSALWRTNSRFGLENAFWLGKILFPLLCAGLISLAWALWQDWRRGAAATAAQAWLGPIVLTAIIMPTAVFFERQHAGRGWFFSMIVVVTTANLLAIGQLLWRARQWRAPLAAALLVSHLLAVVALSAMSGQGEGRRVAVQLTNTLSQAAFVAAAFLLRRGAGKTNPKSLSEKTLAA